MTECTFIYKNTSYYPNINLVSGLNLQLRINLNVFPSICWVMWDRYYLSSTLMIHLISSAFYTVLYADDTYLRLSHNSLDHLQHMLKMDLIK